MRNLKKWKRIIILITAIIIIMRIGYIAFRGEVDKEYYTSTEYDLSNATTVSCQHIEQVFTCEQQRLHSLELAFANISDNKAGTIVLGIYSGDGLLYQTNISISTINNYEWKKIYINAEMSAEKEYRLVLSSSEDCTNIPDILVVENNCADEIKTTYSMGSVINGQVAINYGYLRSPSIADRMVMISLWVILWGLLFAMLYYSDTILKYYMYIKSYLLNYVKPQILVTILEILGCIIIINSSGIVFEAPTKVVLYIISLVATIEYKNKIEYIELLANRSWKKVLIIMLYIYAAFSLVGQRILIYPLDSKITLAGIFVFVCTVFWFIPVVQSILYYMEKVCSYGFSRTKKTKTWQFIVICVLILLVPAAYNLFANNPGISSPDTFLTMITYAQHLHGMTNWHPPFYCMVLGAIEKVWNSTYAVIIVQYFFWAYVVTELMLYLRKKGLKESILIAVIVFTGFNAANYLHINTIWKDIPYTLSLLWTAIIVAKLSIDYEEYKHKWYIYLELVAALVGTYFYRKNGVVSFVIIVIPVAIVLKKNFKLLISLSISILSIFLIKGPVYDHFEVVDLGRGGMYIGLSQDILGVYYSEGEVSEDTLKMINVMTGYNNAEYYYTPTWAYQTYNLAVEPKEFIISYIDTFIKNPITMTRAIIDRVDAAWDIYLGKDSVLGCVNHTGTMDGREEFPEWNDYYPVRKYVSLYNVAGAASSYTALSQWISAIEWRSGLFTLLGLIAIVFLFTKMRIGKYWIIVTPLIGHIMSLLLSTGWSDFRYFWPLNLLNMAIILFVIVIAQNNKFVEVNNA